METPDLQTQDVEAMRPSSSDCRGQGSPGGGGPAVLDLIEFRRQQLHNRRDLLLNTQHVKMKAKGEDCSNTEEPSGEDGELGAIQKELQELEERKEALQGEVFTHCASYQVMPRGGIYMLPSPQLTQEEVTSAQVELKTQPETPTGPAIPVESLSHKPAVTQCPSCDEFVTTETTSTVSETMWALCCLSSMLGCVAGCCVIPFFMDSLRNVRHQCPRCHADIRTHRPI